MHYGLLLNNSPFLLIHCYTTELRIKFNQYAVASGHENLADSRRHRRLRAAEAGKGCNEESGPRQLPKQ